MSLPEPRANPDLLGHDEAAMRLARIVQSGRVPHGWLISGRRGIGKATLAWRFARALLGGAFDAHLYTPPSDRVFRMLESGGHPDLHELTVDPGKSKRAVIRVDQARQIKEQFATTAGLGGRRLLIVDAADDLNPQSANAILKLLEEPPAGTVLILINHVPGRILPTIASRCVRLRLGALPDRIVAELLARARPDLAPERRFRLVALAEGSIGRALQLESSGFVERYERLLERLGREDAPDDAMELVPILAESIQASGPQAPFEVTQAILHRAARLAAGHEPPGLDEPERRFLGNLAARRPLDDWGTVWDKLRRLSARFEPASLSAESAALAVATMLSGETDEPLVLPAPV